MTKFEMPTDAAGAVVLERLVETVERYVEGTYEIEDQARAEGFSADLCADLVELRRVVDDARLAGIIR